MIQKGINKVKTSCLFQESLNARENRVVRQSLDSNSKHEQMQKRSGKIEVEKGGRGAKSGGGGLKD